MPKDTWRNERNRGYAYYVGQSKTRILEATFDEKNAPVVRDPVQKPVKSKLPKKQFPVRNTLNKRNLSTVQVLEQLERLRIKCGSLGEKIGPITRLPSPSRTESLRLFAYALDGITYTNLPLLVEVSRRIGMKAVEELLYLWKNSESPLVKKNAEHVINKLAAQLS